ncbi:MAG TPA: phosphoribosylaminoimidazolesuccinocarboxamide synthase [Gammaproteobacteria bacterium]|nr:phosphoribosylaminoimidazolesuccinocarboxamide synthase [Gammaproteobacteria bacterium]
MTAAPATLFESHLKSLPLHYRGKVRDVYRVDERHLLIIASDRLSAFDVVMPTPIPGKGRILTEISNFWFARTAHIVPNHLTGLAARDVVQDPDDLAQCEGRSVVVKSLKPLPIEAIVRGYLIGSGWKEYREKGSLCGIPLPAGLPLAARLPQPIFTPSTKAARGQHDENIPFAEVERLLGAELARRVREASLALYAFAAEHARARGIIIADTKFEFGVDDEGTLVLIDEALTPDSSRFWPADTYRPGVSPPSFDKQYVRDYLETLKDWNKTAPGPVLPPEVVAKTAEKYQEALRRLTA